MKAIVGILILCIIIGIAACSRYDRSPESKFLPPAKLAFYHCQKCESLEGGIYGKGSFKQFKSDKARKCIHNLETVSKQEFKQLASNGYKADWSKEITWWQTNE